MSEVKPKLVIDCIENYVYRLAVSPCGTRVAAVADGITFYKTESRSAVATLGKRDTEANCLMFSADNRLFVTAGGGDLYDAMKRIRVYDATSLDQIANFEAHRSNVRMARFNFDQSILVSCGVDARVKLWDTENWELVAELSGHEQNVQDVWFSNDGQRIISGGLDGKPRTWDVAERRTIAVFEGHVEGDNRDQRNFSVAFNPDATVGVSGSAGGKIRAWNAETAEQIAEIDTGDAVNYLAFTPDGGTLIAVLWDGPFLVINPKTWEIKTKVESHSERTHGHALTIDGTTLVTGSADCTIKFWDINELGIQS